MSIKVRKANAKDSKIILALLQQLKESAYREMGEPQKFEIKKESLPLLAKFIKENDYFILLAEKNSQIVGLITAYIIPKILDAKYRMIIEAFVVNKKYQDQGIGSKLLEAIENEARKHNIDDIKVATGTKLKANKFYIKHGFKHFENMYRKKIMI